MKREELYNAPKYAGIYYFKNNINGKYYIGQAIKLRRRLLKHMSNLDTNRYDLPLYRAFKKYGLENFSWGILDTFTEALSKETKIKLDELEIKYIKEYNSYGKTGYNSTLGGDAGVLGLKHNQETKDKLSSLNSQVFEEQCRNPENWVKAKNWENGYTVVSISIECLAKYLKVNRVQISKCLNKHQNSINRVWTICRYNEEFPELKINNDTTIKQKVIEILDSNPNITPTEALNIYSINKSTFCRYRKELGKVPSCRPDTKIKKEEFIEYVSNHSFREAAKYFNISKDRLYKYKKKYLNGRDT